MRAIGLTVGVVGFAYAIGRFAPASAVDAAFGWGLRLLDVPLLG
jgi:hypothetical protein